MGTMVVATAGEDADNGINGDRHVTTHIANEHLRMTQEYASTTLCVGRWTYAIMAGRVRQSPTGELAMDATYLMILGIP
jgi:hypothetical protein